MKVNGVSEFISDNLVHSKIINKIFVPICYSSNKITKNDIEFIIIAFTNRSGSNLLMEYLGQISITACRDEILNIDNILRRKKQCDTLAEYILENAPTTKTKQLAIKASWEQIMLLHQHGVLNYFKSVKVVHIERKNKIYQAVSHLIATQTGKWTSKMKSRAQQATYSYEKIDQILMQKHYENAAIMNICKSLRLSYTQIFYENLERNPKAVLNRLLKFFSIEGEINKLESPTIVKQRNSLNEKMVSQYLSEMENYL